MKRLFALALTLALLFAALTLPAAAEVRRGSKGAEVLELQKLLVETGWLEEAPDGVFGRNTEAAVMSFQSSMGLPVTGVADDLTVASLMEVLEGIVGEGEEEGDPPVCCVRVDDGSTVIAVDCAAHRELHAQAEALLGTGRAEDAEKAVALWQEDLTALYDRWMQAAAPADRLNVIAARATFLAFAENQRAAIGALDKDDAQYMYWLEEALLHEQAGRVCQLLWDIEGEGGEGE